MNASEEPTRYGEEDLLPLSGLQHMVFCDRQAALIHVEGIWIDNGLTVEGSHLHRVVDDGGSRVRDGVHTARGLALVSYHLGLIGKADVVELTPAPRERGGVDLVDPPGRWHLTPVEYKRGTPKAHRADEVQLCAQALCLEEQFGVEIEEGSLFYGKTRRRQQVVFDSRLRRLTEEIARSFHELIRTQRTPVRRREKKCEQCSLFPACLPPRSVARSGKDFLHDWIGSLELR